MQLQSYQARFSPNVFQIFLESVAENPIKTFIWSITDVKEERRTETGDRRNTGSVSQKEKEDSGLLASESERYEMWCTAVVI